jgi:hypothetical protein
MSQIAILAPSFAIATAIAFPRPWGTVAPVTNATLSLSFIDHLAARV